MSYFSAWKPKDRGHGLRRKKRIAPPAPPAPAQAANDAATTERAAGVGANVPDSTTRRPAR